MRDRHFPRLCRSCHAPMARQEETCWRCGSPWADEEAPQTALRVVVGGAPTYEDADRWINEGGSVEPEAAPLRVAAARR